MSKDAINTLVEYCQQNGITIHPSLHAKQVPGAGLGIYATSPTKADKTIVYVPNKHIFTTASIPESFLSQSARKDLPVHAQLAAYLAFGDISLDEWTATWPPLEDFTSGMPIFWNHWGSSIMFALDSGSEHPPKRRRLTIDNSQPSSPEISLSPLLTGWTSTTSTQVLPKMVTKLISHIRLINTALPDLLNQSNLHRFLHMWAIVNTRCFYYIPPSQSNKRQKAPSDPNEAMALCPFMDLFNHTSTQHSPCRAKYTNTGFEIITKHGVSADSEILLSYGAHGNDMLWAEYGFIMSKNANDSILLDEIVMEGIKDVDREVLEEAGYLGTYTLYGDGSICYRMEMVAWCLVLGRQKWKKVVGEGGDPEENCTSPTGGEKFRGHVLGWLEQAGELAQQNEERLTELNGDELKDCFGIIDAVPESSSEIVEVAEKRRDMALMRWRQIQDMIELGVQNISEGQ